MDTGNKLLVMAWCAAALLDPVTARARETAGNPDGVVPVAVLEATRLMDEGRFLDAEKVLVPALAWAKANGPDESALAVLARPMTRLHIGLGRYREAETFARQALTHAEARFGKSAPELAVDQNNLAGVYFSQGLYTKAEALYRRALEIHTATLGPAHPEAALVRGNLACIYTLLRQYAEAERLHRETLKLFEKTLSPQDPRLATGLTNVAILRFKQGAVTDAASLFEAAVGILEKGPPSGPLGMALANLGMMRRHLGKPAEAEALLVRAIPLIESTMGAEHPHLAGVLEEYAAALRSLHRKEEAKRIRQRVRALMEINRQETYPGKATIDARALQ